MMTTTGVPLTPKLLICASQLAATALQVAGPALPALRRLAPKLADFPQAVWRRAVFGQVQAVGGSTWISYAAPHDNVRHRGRGNSLLVSELILKHFCASRRLPATTTPA